MIFNMTFIESVAFIINKAFITISKYINMYVLSQTHQPNPKAMSK